MKKQRHTAEFKRKAARLMIMDGLSAPEVSERLDVYTGLLSRWKRGHLVAPFHKGGSDHTSEIRPKPIWSGLRKLSH